MSSEPIPANALPVASLAQRRREAVRLRLEGTTLARISKATGLSAPTIISAHKAYASGGWSAVDAATPGRPRRGQEEKLSAQQESALRQAVLTQTPAGAGLSAHLWQLPVLRKWAQKQWGVDISERHLARLLQRWQVHAPSVLDAYRSHPDAAARQWLDTDYPALGERIRQAGGSLLWAGAQALGSTPAAGRSGAQHLLYAHNPRGRMAWLATPHPPTAADWQSFLLGLGADFGLPLALVMPHPPFAYNPELQAWLSTRSGLLALIEPPAPGIAPAQNRASAPSSVPPLLNLNERPLMPLTHLQRLEAESIHIMREVVAEASNPVMLYSIGKDSAVMLHLARKAFFPAPPPFALLHVDTRWKFRDMYTFRDHMAKEAGMDLLVHINPEGIEKDINPFTHGSAIHTDIMKTEGLKQALDKYGFDAAFGGARRDEEKSRAKERIFSFRSAQHRWDPKSQRPELWKLYNARKHKGESMRVFPISNWTELDIWQYIHLESIPIVPLYYSAVRPVVARDGALIMVDDERMPLNPGEVPMMKKVRFRTLGCYPLTGAVESDADNLQDIIQEMLLTKTSERQGRVIDHDSAASMEKKKQEGYF